MIRDLQARSGARIEVGQDVTRGQTRGITYRGPRKNVVFAKHLVHLLLVQGVHENDLPLGEASQELFIIPSISVGKVIGHRKCFDRDIPVFLLIALLELLSQRLCI